MSLCKLVIKIFIPRQVAKFRKQHGRFNIISLHFFLTDIITYKGLILEKKQIISFVTDCLGKFVWVLMSKEVNLTKFRRKSKDLDKQPWQIYGI